MPAPTPDEALAALAQENADLKAALMAAELAVDNALLGQRRESQRRQVIVKANEVLDAALFMARLTQAVLEASLAGSDLDRFSEAFFGLIGRVVDHRWIGLRLDLDGQPYQHMAPGPDALGERLLATESLEGGAFRHVFSREGRPVGQLVCLPRGARTTQKEYEILSQLCQQATPILERNMLIRQLEIMATFREDFVNMLSHDLRNPLTGVISALSALDIPGLALRDEDRRRITHGALMSARIANEMIDDLLDVAKLEAGRLVVAKEPLDLAAVADDCLTQVRYVAEAKNLALVLDAPDGLPLVCGERKKLLRVFVNLVGNALKYTQSGGVLVQLREAAGQVTVAVADSGIGIPPEAQGQLFQKFYQVAGRSRAGLGGTGLGLAYCRQMIEAHGGRVWVTSPSRLARESGRLPAGSDSERALGTVFHFSLPAEGAPGA